MIYNPNTHPQDEQLQEPEKRDGALYVARFCQPLGIGDVVLELHPVTYSMYLSYTDTYILTKEVPIHREFVTRLLEHNYLNKEIVLSPEKTVFYSESKDACYEWLTDKQREAIDFATYNLHRLSDAEIIEMDEENFVCTQQKQKL